MKHFKHLLLVLIALVTFACGKSEPENTEPTPAPKPTDKIELAAGTDLNPVISTDGGTLSVTFNASTAWSAQAVNDRADGWCSVSPTSGNAGSGTITITAKANTEPDERSASINIKAGTATQTIKVTQKQKDALTVTSSTFEVPAEGKDINIEVKANINITYKIDQQCSDWIKYVSTKALKTSTLTFAVSKNENVEKREGKIIIGEGALSDTIKIFQAGETPSIVLNKDEYIAKSEGETFAIEVASNVDVSYHIEYTHEDGTINTDSENWLQESRTRTMSTNTYYFDIAKNESFEDRFARIVFINKENNLCDTIFVFQHKYAFIELSKSEYLISDAGETIEVSINSNIEYSKIMPQCNWVIELPNNTNKNSHKFQVNKNLSDSTRYAEILFINKEYGISDTLKITQKGGSDFFFEERNITLPYKETIFPVKVLMRDFSASYKITIESEWIENYQRTKSTMVSGTHYFKASQNNSDTTRQGRIICKNEYSNLSDTLYVTQLPATAAISKNFSIANKEYNVPMNAHRILLKIEHEGQYYIDDNNDVNLWDGDKESKFSDGNIDYYMAGIGETVTPRDLFLFVWDKTRTICDTITIHQGESNEYLHFGHGQNIGIGLIVPYNGIEISLNIHTNSDNYEIIQKPSINGLTAKHLKREKSDTGYTEYFMTPINNSDITQIASVIFASKNIAYEVNIKVRPKLKIIFDSPQEMVIPHSGRQFSTNVWTNDDNLNIKIEGDNTAWLRTVNHEKESQDSFTRIISTFEASANTTGKDREAYIVAYNGFGNSEKVKVTQPSGGNIIISESKYYLGAWEQTMKVKIIDCNYKIEMEGGDGWINIGQADPGNGIIIQNLNIAPNATGQERNAAVIFTSDTIVNKIELIQLPESDALIDNSPEKWKSFQLPKVNFKTPYPGSAGTMIYNAIVKDPALLIAVESRKVLDQLYYSPDDKFIPRRDEIEYVLDNYDGISAFYSGNNISGIVLSNQYIENYYKQNGVIKLVDENRGVLSHELTHSFQLSPKGVGDYSNPIFHACIEGMADAVRVLTGHFTEADRPKGGSYKDSYGYTGFFIAWLVKNKDKDFLRKFNLSTQYLEVWSFDGAVKYALGNQYNVDDLWTEYQRAMGDIK